MAEKDYTDITKNLKLVKIYSPIFIFCLLIILCHILVNNYNTAEIIPNWGVLNPIIKALDIQGQINFLGWIFFAVLSGYASLIYWFKIGFRYTKRPFLIAYIFFCVAFPIEPAFYFCVLIILIWIIAWIRAKREKETYKKIELRKGLGSLLIYLIFITFFINLIWYTADYPLDKKMSFWEYKSPTVEVYSKINIMDYIMPDEDKETTKISDSSKQIFMLSEQTKKRVNIIYFFLIYFFSNYLIYQNEKKGLIEVGKGSGNPVLAIVVNILAYLIFVNKYIPEPFLFTTKQGFGILYCSILGPGPVMLIMILLSRKYKK